MKLNRLLARQLKKSGFDTEKESLDPRLLKLIEKVNSTYNQSDEERYTNERANDISSREMQQLYEKLEASSKSALKLERDKLNRILMNIGYGLMVLDSQDVIIEANIATRAIIGCSQDFLINRNFYDLLSQSNNPHYSGTELLTDNAVLRVSEDAEPIQISFIKTPIESQDRDAGSVIVFHDISETIAQNESLIEARNLAQQANKAKSDFLSRMSHELRTPLHAILGFTQLLSMDKPQFSTTQNNNLAEIEKAGSHLLSLINELLDFSRIEAGKVNIDIEELSLGFHLSECAELMLPQASQKDVIIENMAQDMGVFVYADKIRLKQVVINLLSNAIKYNKQGGKLRLSMSNNGDRMVRFGVSDQGEGLTQDEVALLFKSYERPGQVKGIEGTGIGLVITRKLVELMGGAISVDSTPGVGTSFYVDLRRVID